MAEESVRDNVQVIETFFECFKNKDGTGMGSCYHPEVTFKDPVFTLKGSEVTHMWVMLTSRADEHFKIEYSNVKADENDPSVVTAHWDAYYKYKGRDVHNIIDSRFVLEAGEVIDQVDSFDLYRWSRMALGKTGVFLGWTSMFKKQIRTGARKGLDKWIERSRKQSDASEFEPAAPVDFPASPTPTA